MTAGSSAAQTGRPCRKEQRPPRADPFGQDAERHLQRDVAGHEDGKQRGDARFRPAVRRAVNRHQRQHRLLESGRDEDGKKHQRRLRQEAEHRDLPAIAGDVGQPREDGEEDRGAEKESGDADQERCPALAADQGQGQGTAGKSGRYDRGIDTKNAAPLRRGRNGDHPGFAEHVERIDCQAEEEAQRKPEPEILLPGDQREKNR